MRRSLVAALVSSLCLGSFLCLGMGMGMGVAFAQTPAAGHDCCADGDSDKGKQSFDCCSILPAAAASSVDLPSSGGWTALAAERPLAPALPPSEQTVLATGPPGRPSPAFSLPSSPRAPPAA